MFSPSPAQGVVESFIATLVVEPVKKSKPDLVIRVDWFKSSGKWAYGGEVNVGHARLWMGDAFKQAIVSNQDIIRDGWQNNDWVVVTRDLSEEWAKREYREFSSQYYPAGSFNGLYKHVISDGL